MMTLVCVSITVAFFCSSAVTFGPQGKVFFWELASSHRYHAARPLDRRVCALQNFLAPFGHKFNPRFLINTLRHQIIVCSTGVGGRLLDQLEGFPLRQRSGRRCQRYGR
jgi:hypothetical protein